jgi:uncharacterized repeat protein (TIGR01451 family)
VTKASFTQKQRLLVVALGVILLLGVVWWPGEPEPSWAAPGQSPGQQTIPGRDDTPTPSIPPTAIPPATPVPTREAPVSNEDEDDDEDGEADSTEQPETQPQAETPTETPIAAPAEPEASPEQPAQPEDNGDQNPVQSPPGQGKDEGDPSVGTGLLADLYLEKIASNLAPQPGETVTFTLTLGNNGPDTATQVVVNELLPFQLGLISMAASQGSYDIGQGRWTVEMLPPMQRITLNIVARVIGAGVITNSTEIMAVDQPDPDSTPNNSLDYEDDQASVSLLVTPETAPQENPSQEATPSAPVEGGAARPGGVAAPEDALSLYWLYALILGVLLFFGGLFLVRHS